jgi:predicted RNase H-like nuclease (RuvC/YqgF family)
MATNGSNSPESAGKQFLRRVVQDELKPVKEEMQGMKTELQQVKSDIQQVRKEMRDYHDEVATMKDEIIAELQASREESVVDKSIHRRVLDLEDEVDQLKRIHPQGTHAH